MLKKQRIIPFVLGFITYFIITVILNRFDVNTAINRFAVLALVVLVSSTIIHFYNKGKS